MSVEFALKLQEQVAGPAKKAADALKSVETQAKKAQSALDFSKELHRAESALNKIKFDPKGYRELLKAQRELAEQRKKIQKEVGRESFVEAFKSKLSLGRLTTAAFFGDLLAEGLMKGVETAVDLLKEGIVEAFKAGSQVEQLRLGYKLSLGEEGGKSALEDVERFSKLTGMDDDTIAKLILPLRRAGLDQGASRTAFAAASDIAAGRGNGGSAEDIGGSLSAFEHIKLKGGVTEKLLVNQLGVNAQEFYKSLATQLGVSVDEAKKKAEHGGAVDPQRLLNTIYAGIEQRQGGKIGTGTIEFSKTFQGRLNKLRSLPEEYLKTISSSPAWKKLSDRMGNVFEALSPDGPRGQKIIAKIQEVFGKVADWIDRAFTPEHIDEFLSVLGKLPEVLKTILTVLEAIAVIWAGGKIVSGLATLGALGAPLLAVAAALGAVAAAVSRISAAADELYAPGRGWEQFTSDLNHARFGKDAIAGDNTSPSATKYREEQARNLELARSKVRQGGGGFSVNAPVSINVNGHGDTSQVAQAVGATIGKHIETASERAAQEAGL